MKRTNRIAILKAQSGGDAKTWAQRITKIFHGRGIGTVTVANIIKYRHTVPTKGYWLRDNKSLLVMALL